MKYVLKDESLFGRIRLMLENDSEPDLETLEAHFMVNYGRLESCYGTSVLMDAYRLKIEAMKNKVSLMESTMSTSQLYNAGNSLWAKNVSIEQIVQIKKLEEKDDMTTILKQLNAA